MIFSMYLLTPFILFPRCATFSLPRVPIGANAEYMEHLASSGILEKSFFSPPPVDPLHVSLIKGASYIPSTAPNCIGHWHDYSSSLTKTELGFAASGGMNHIKLTLSWVNWFVEPDLFLANLEDTVAISHSLNLSVSFALFEGPGDDLQGNAVSVLTSGGYRTRNWVSSPGDSQLKNATLLSILDNYVSNLTSKYGHDPRVVGWDVLFQPNLCGSDPACPLPSFLSRYLTLVNQGVVPTNSWVTTSIIPGAATCDSKNIPPGRTVVGFNNYNGNPGAVGGDAGYVLSCGSTLNPKAPLPVLLAASMGRAETPPSAVCEILFEAYGEAYSPLGIPAHARIGVIIPSLMIGVNQFTAPPTYNQGLIFPNGTWYSELERLCFSQVVPPLPPPPPGPPPSVLNFSTSDGLFLGLRNSTRAVQFLGINGDTRWFRNFSFVPPLWNVSKQDHTHTHTHTHPTSTTTTHTRARARTHARSFSSFPQSLIGITVVTTIWVT